MHACHAAYSHANCGYLSAPVMLYPFHLLVKNVCVLDRINVYALQKYLLVIKQFKKNKTYRYAI